MAKGHYLVIQDKTTCGGIITEGDITHTLFGRAIAREQDRVTCGKHPGTYIIVGHIPNDTVNGRKFAGTLHSFSSCPCKARFIPSMLNDTYELSSATTTATSDASSAEPEQSLSFTPSPVTPVFAKSCERGEGCTDAGEQQEPHTNFAPVGYFRSVPLPEPEQHAQAAKRAKSAPVATEAAKKAKPGWYTWLFGEGDDVAPVAATVAVPASKVFPSGSAALEWLGGRFVTQGSWAIRAVTAFGEVAAAGIGAPVAAALVGMMPGKLNEGEQDFIDKMRLSQIAGAKGTAPTRVRFAWEDAGNGRLMPKGYHTSEGSGLDQVPVREMTFNSYTGNYEFTTDGPDAITIYWNPAKLDLEVPSHTGNQDEPYLPTTITVLPIPDKVGSDIEVYPAPEERSFRDYILILPIPDMPPVYIYLSKPPVEFLDVDLYSNLKRRSRQGKYEADHMPSSAAVRAALLRDNPRLSKELLDEMVQDVAAIVIPKEVHQKLSETYGGRNSPAQIDLDSRNLRAAVDSNLDAIKPALKEHGATEAQIEAARAKMHELNSGMGLYK
ncbi:S-type pyocin domain-containing protein [Serratia oryzae]|uniref:S-type pyocin domain-containing protein n=1 Tax=Serratia oryzae TaxID=2034155 RepID=UPI0012E14842|nr:S-type pyocin domain-containing protein [Serratia oryzae]